MTHPHALSISRAATLLSTLPLLCAPLWLTGCSSTGPTYAQPPLNVPPNTVPAYVEKINNGSIFQQNMDTASLFSAEKRPRHVGDSLKILVVERSNASGNVNTNTHRKNEVAVNGPGDGASGSGNFLSKLINLNAQASGNDAFKGSGSTSSSNSLSAEISASVINVLPNGHLVVAGERGVSINGNVTALRVSGIVNPKDIGTGNLVSSANMLNARFEVGGQGDVADASGRNWLQRVLTKNLTIW